MIDNSQVYKIILLGDANVGKTSIINKERSVLADPQNTICNEIYDLNINGLTLKIIDTAGQERFRSIAKSMFRGASVALLVFDLTNSDSFKALTEFKENFKQVNDDAEIILVGNKCDLSQYSVSEAEIKTLAEEWGTQYFLTSALDGTQINELFKCVAQIAQNYNQIIDSVNPNQNEKDQLESKKCC